ncbi:MAG: amidohydrolase [Phycisphaeraceae bacterium]|nr:amidohydrolase [Phycisphaeraceae bacterium]MCW5755374.1 amidohydrolase [Phycisphaeraceae bacterium]
MSTDLLALITRELPDLITIRRDLHAHPELAFQEQRTSRFVQQELTRLGIPFKAGYAKGTGVVAHLAATTGQARPAVALRADMDALPILENTNRPYASTNQGVMHACGHDGHTAILLGAARVLAATPHRPNPVTFLFQPAEEGGGGGGLMCDEGALAGDDKGGLGPPVGRVFGLHGWPQLPLNHVATRPGPLLAATDDFEVFIRGTQAHGAYPHLGHDPIVASAHVVTALQTIASRTTSPTEAVVVSVGVIEGGTANNIIPDRVRLVGTVRTLSPLVRQAAKSAFYRLIESTAQAHGCLAEIHWHDGYPATINDPAATAEVFKVARATFGDDRVHEVPNATMGGEDFSYYGRIAPACFFLLGLKPSGMGDVPQLHQAEFDFNDEAISAGIEMMCRLALNDEPRPASIRA